MKDILKCFIVPILLLGSMSAVNAQNTREFKRDGNRGSSSRESYHPQRHMETRSAPVRSFNNTARTTPVRNNNYRERTVAVRDYNYNRTRSYTTVNNYHFANNRYYGTVYGRTTYFMAGPRYSVIPHTFISINFGGHPYYYNRGFYYGYYGGFYQPIFPPFGLRISVLPFGYSSFYWGGIPYYYYNGIYYRNYDNYYEVVDAPMGAIVSSLPAGVRSVIINGEQFYQLNGTYYKAETDSNGGTIYQVVGKNGVINNSQAAPNMQPDDQSQVVPPDNSLQVGDIINSLPEGSKIVTVNGQELYETPDNVYLQKEDIGGNIQYKVVGK